MHETLSIIVERTVPAIARHLPPGTLLTLDLQSQRALPEERAAAPIRALLQAAARYGAPPQVTIRTRDLAGDDGEVTIEGLRFPDGFPEKGPQADAWRVAEMFLRKHHRARVRTSDDRFLMLIPARERARDLRGDASTRPPQGL